MVPGRELRTGAGARGELDGYRRAGQAFSETTDGRQDDEGCGSCRWNERAYGSSTSLPPRLGQLTRPRKPLDSNPSCIEESHRGTQRTFPSPTRPCTGRGMPHPSARMRNSMPRNRRHSSDTHTRTVSRRTSRTFENDSPNTRSTPRQRLLARQTGWHRCPGRTDLRLPDPRHRRGHSCHYHTQQAQSS
jgi:hypothetical protein